MLGLGKMFDIVSVPLLGVDIIIARRGFFIQALKMCETEVGISLSVSICNLE